MYLDEIIPKLTILCGNAYLLYNVDIQIFNNKGYILDMCLCVQIMENRAVSWMEQSESLPPRYPSPPLYTPDSEVSKPARALSV